jgi:hypothetical protein
MLKATISSCCAQRLLWALLAALYIGQRRAGLRCFTALAAAGSEVGGQLARASSRRPIRA